MTPLEEHFAAHGFVRLEVDSPEGLSSAEAAHWARIFDADRQTDGWVVGETEMGWTERGGTSEQTVNGDLLLTSPIFDGLVRHPRIIGAIERIFGGKCCLAESCLRHMEPFSGPAYQSWHRCPLLLPLRHPPPPSPAPV